MIKVVVDAFGGDNSPDEIIAGIKKALDIENELFVVIAGNKEIILEKMKDFIDTERYSILEADEIIENNESPTMAIRMKKNSSIVRSFEELRSNDEYVGFVSAGSTGAVLTGAFLKLGRIRGVSRPALCPILPTKVGGKVGIVDSGANMDAKPINLLHFAIMGNEYLKSVYGIENPRIALLNVGVEEHKGNELTKQVYEMLKAEESLNFVGNMEARELLSGDYDLVVCDGFAGNVLLKSTEGAVLNLLSMLKKEIKASFLSKIGACLMKKSFKNLKLKLDYNKNGGAVLLGCKKIVVKSHGSSKADSICASILQVVTMARANLTEKITNIADNLKTDESAE